MCSFWLFLFDDKRLLSGLLALWTIVSSVIFVMIMIKDDSKFLYCGPNSKNLLFGVALDTWSKWWAVALYTFFSTCIAAFSGDSIIPFLTNVVMDPKTKYIPYSKLTCLTIIQVQTIYGIISLIHMKCISHIFSDPNCSVVQEFVSASSAHLSHFHRYENTACKYYICYNIIR